ncbi:MAG TPA: YciI family protein [Opitutaceae bacterium]|nr:YciI family protein [Opitutaceae bacterium]
MPVPRLLRLGCCLLACLAAGVAARAATADPADAKPATAKKHYLYFLRLVERLHAEAAWTPADEEAVGRHFRHLKAAVERGQVVLAGKTDETGDRTFGLVIFEAPDDDAARAFMESDPAVAAKVMTAELRPFHPVFLRKG